MNTLKTIAISSLLAFGLAMPALADEQGTQDVAAQDRGECFDLGRVKTQRVQDRQNVLVEMRDGTNYMVTTVNRCAGLRKNGSVIYDVRSPNRQVCPMDSIKASTTGSIRTGFIAPCPIHTILEVDPDAVETVDAEEGTDDAS